MKTQSRGAVFLFCARARDAYNASSPLARLCPGVPGGSRQKPVGACNRPQAACGRFQTVLPAAVAAAVFCVLAGGAVWGQPSAPKDVSSDLRAADVAARHEAAEKLLYGKGTAADESVFVAAASERNPQVRSELLRVIAARGGEGALAALAAALGADLSPLVRMVAAQELGRCGGEAQALFALSDALVLDASPDVRAACAAALAFHAASTAAQALADAAADPDPAVRAAAAFGLSRQAKTPETESALDDLARDKDPKVVEAVRRWRRK